MGPPQSRRLRIVHVLDNLNLGGTELNAVRTAEQLDRDRFDVEFLCLRTDGPLRARLDGAGIPVTEMPVSGVVGMDAIRWGRALRAKVRREGIDVVHAHDPYGNVLAAPWVHWSGRGAVICSHRWWRQVHRARLRIANRMAYRFADRVLANSPSVGELVVRDEGVPRDRVVVIPNFVDEAAFQPLLPDRVRELRAQLGVAEGQLLIGIIANLYPVKDHATLLRAAARISPGFPDARFILVGEGGERERLAALVAQAGIGSQVVMPGHFPHEPGLPSLFDIAVLTSVEEGFPNYVVEAMAAGRPVVATRVGGVPDAVVEGETGLLVPTGDDESLAQALATLLRDPMLRQRMGGAGARVARERYHVAVVMKALSVLYHSLARGSQPGGAT